MIDIVEWIDRSVGPGCIWYAKRLSYNDTQRSGSHQAGPYISKDMLFRLFPDLNDPNEENPRVEFDMYIDSDADHRRVNAIWYNNKMRGGTRNETRLTGFGGAGSAFLDPESAGAIAVFAFRLVSKATKTCCHAWICRNGLEEDVVEDNIGLIPPNRAIIWPSRHPLMSGVTREPRTLLQRCRLSADRMPTEWLNGYPSAREMVEKTIELTGITGSLEPDSRILRRVDCEFELFRSVEEVNELPVIKRGFNNMDGFLDRAKAVTQRRRARAGLSLELHTRQIFVEEGLVEDEDFAYQPRSEGRKRPDFLFPSEAAYADSGYPDHSLAMLAVKRSAKDRWRQILNEAGRVQRKHLFTIQDSVSEAQVREMIDASVQLVVPRPFIGNYSPSVRDALITLEDFVTHVRLLRGQGEKK